MTVWTAPTPAPLINLEQLDQLGEILGNVSVPAGTYTAARCSRRRPTPATVLLTVAANPRAGFPATPGTSIRPEPIQIQRTQGSSGNLTVPVDCQLRQPARRSRPAEQQRGTRSGVRPGASGVHRGAHSAGRRDGATLWAVNFDGPVRRHPIADMRRPGAAAHLVRQRWSRGELGQPRSITIDQGLPGVAGDQPGDRDHQHEPLTDPRRCHQRHDLLRPGCRHAHGRSTTSRTGDVARWPVRAHRRALPGERHAGRRCASGPAATSTRCG